MIAKRADLLGGCASSDCCLLEGRERLRGGALNLGALLLVDILQVLGRRHGWETGVRTRGEESPE